MPRLDDEVLAFYNNSRAAYNRGDISTAETWYRRLRAEHGVELFYEVELPQNIKFVHSIGSVLGRADYGEFLVVYHGCGVGSDVDGNRPKLGSGVVLFPGAKILGNATLGNNVWVTANTVVQNCDVPDNSVVFGGVTSNEWVYGGEPVTTYEACVRWKLTTRSVKKQFFGVEL